MRVALGTDGLGLALTREKQDKAGHGDAGTDDLRPSIRKKYIFHS
jgi:hypothetical protein